MTDPCEEIMREFQRQSDKKIEDMRIHFEKEIIQLKEEIIELKQFKVNVSGSVKTLVKPMIQAIVGELLLFCIGVQPKKFSHSTYFSSNVLPKNSSLKPDNLSWRLNIIMKDIFKFVENFEGVADQLIDRCNSAVHFQSAELDIKIKEALDEFDKFPELNQELRNEKIILDAFQKIKEKVLLVQDV